MLSRVDRVERVLPPEIFRVCRVGFFLMNRQIIYSDAITLVVITSFYILIYIDLPLVESKKDGNE